MGRLRLVPASASLLVAFVLQPVASAQLAVCPTPFPNILIVQSQPQSNDIISGSAGLKATVASSTNEIERIEIYINMRLAQTVAGDALAKVGGGNRHEYTIETTVSSSQVNPGLVLSPAINVIRLIAWDRTGNCNVSAATTVFGRDPSTRAIIIGVSEYESTRPELQYADDDALAMRDHLVAIGIDPKNIRTLLNEQATDKNIRLAFADVGDAISTDGTLIFYFSGHGFTESYENESFLVVYDDDVRALPRLSPGGLSSLLKRSRAGNRIIIIDACFAAGGAAAGVVGDAYVARRVTVSASTEARRWDGLNQPGTLSLFSSDASQPSYEFKELEHGVFTHFLLNPPPDLATAVSLDEAFRQVTIKVREYLAGKGLSQTPDKLEGPGGFRLSQETVWWK